MKFYIADAFAEELFGGNPAGVVILDKDGAFPSPEIMQKTAAELRYSETAFIQQLGPNQFQLRYFTPAAEVALCGHATIASFAALSEAGLIKDESRCTARTLAGDLRIELDRGFIMMGMGIPEHLGTIRQSAELDELYSIMGLSRAHQATITKGGHRTVLYPEIISTGLPDILLPLKDQESLSAIRPDFPALAKLSQKHQATGIHAFTLDPCSPGVTAHCRNFAPLFGIDEEAATGTASGALTHYLFAHQFITSGQTYTFIQGEAMGRPSKILSRVLPQDSRLIQVGGSAKILAQGIIHL